MVRHVLVILNLYLKDNIYRIAKRYPLMLWNSHIHLKIQPESVSFIFIGVFFIFVFPQVNVIRTHIVGTKYYLFV